MRLLSIPVHPSALPPIVLYAAPMIFALVALEWGLSIKENKALYNKKDFWTSLAIGIGNLGSSALTKVALFAFFLFVYNWIPWHIPATAWSLVACLVTFDFCSYWAHRIAHEQRFWWATHVTHHSAESFNLAVSFRQSWVQQLKLVFFVPVLVCGFHPAIFYLTSQISLLYQFWTHAGMVGKLHPLIEYVFVTPSHHRVHHGKNPRYIDKNYGACLIIWDRLFGTFQIEDEEPEYGITHPVESSNPVYLVFHEYISLYQDLRKAQSLKEAWVYLFGRPGAVYQKDKEKETH
ncbi:sterol desaturase family protein [Xanthocytophaga agilis]|uniref:Sterol desaturase family protein n=1 Tax=Xanthocytophaga agilis TaxID=3048010 RepID=A0AAE3UEV5_9BACT|nr:sterol desaturase family protein [Xanthocytophaga agilis]MDJ1503158.1 sterol desaturase family protein [Xanthocytophaga agilis]